MLIDLLIDFTLITVGGAIELAALTRRRFHRRACPICRGRAQ